MTAIRLTFGLSQRPAMTRAWHLRTVIIPRRTIPAACARTGLAAPRTAVVGCTKSSSRNGCLAAVSAVVLDHEVPLPYGCPIRRRLVLQPPTPRRNATIVRTIVRRAISTIISPPISVVWSAISISIICGGVAAVVGGRIATVVAGSVVAIAGPVIPISRAVSVCVGSQTADKGAGN